MLFYWAVKELEMRNAQEARWLGIGQPAVQRSVGHGGIARELNLVFFSKQSIKASPSHCCSPKGCEAISAELGIGLVGWRIASEGYFLTGVQAS